MKTIVTTYCLLTVVNSIDFIKNFDDLEDDSKKICAEENDNYSCVKWMKIANGFCEGVHRYEVYSFQELDKDNKASDEHPYTL